ncbi:MAG: tubulin-like doman-containing protein [Defluviitaleaceae bacterium]|nr:tubulin-like doman-containing protein [Defluviitaleaceae bacterium]
MTAPTLLVGLGGTGSKIIRKVAKLASDEQRRHLGFAAFDTDINELRDIKAADPFVKTIQTSTKLSVGEYLNIDTHARDTWFPVNTFLNSKALTEGAGQVRAVSRLALDTAIRAGKMEPLHDAIHDLYKLEEGKGEQALRIIIVSSLAGGTGSGILLPVAMYIKNYLSTRFRQNSNITRGFFILPEVFYEVIRGQTERNTLKCNAYAALRELDAFLMKGDETLHDKYSDTVKLQFPRIGSDVYDEYDVRPYDFCFLFDAQNAEGKKLNSFDQYIDHAADCVYAQSIGPMNKRSNSSEDNTIRKLVAERGRNRYAGAGSSMLIYPFEDVRKYISLNWANECVSKQWLMFDEMYNELLRRNADKRNKGIAAADINRARNYIDTVEAGAKDKNPFARFIENSCYLYDDDGLNKIASKWTVYVSSLIKKINSDQSFGQKDLDERRTQAMSFFNELEGGKESWSKFDETYQEIDKYRAVVIKRREETADTIAYSMFRAQDGPVTAEKHLYKLETYLEDSEGKFLHPNAVRYFLYKTYELLQSEKRKYSNKNSESVTFFEDFEKLHVHKSDDGDDAIVSYADRDVPFMNRLFGGLSEEMRDAKTALNLYISEIDEYRAASIVELVLDEGIKYVSKLSDSFEDFYSSFKGKISEIESGIANIKKKYRESKGTAARYVCASETALNKLLESMPYAGGSINIGEQLSEDIYNRIYKYAMLPSRPSNNSYFSELFEVGILGYFQDELMRKHGSMVDMDIITALETEAKYDENKIEDKDIQKYVEVVIDTTRKLSCPFIESPLGEQRDSIDICAFSQEIYTDDISPRSLMIDKELMNYGGVMDNSIGKNMILFYQSYYGLRANDLGKFAPPEASLTSKRDGGEYYKAYFDLVSKIHPVPHLSRALTPHIDKWWHIITKMPDLDETNQVIQEDRIYAAFFWGLVRGLFDVYETSFEKKVYRLKVDRLGMSDTSENMIVSSGTACDNLYKVLDAFAIYPELVCKILDRVEYVVSEDVANSTSDTIENGDIYKSLTLFKVTEFPLGDDDGYRSIFEIPLLMKKAITPELYIEEDVLRILRASIREIKKYIVRMCSDKLVSKVFGEILMDHYELYIKNLERLSKDSLYDHYDHLFVKTSEIIGMVLEENGLMADARAVRKNVDDMKAYGGDGKAAKV